MQHIRKNTGKKETDIQGEEKRGVGGEQLTYFSTPHLLLHDAAVPVVLHAPVIKVRLVSVFPPIIAGQKKRISTEEQ